MVEFTHLYFWEKIGCITKRVDCIGCGTKDITKGLVIATVILPNLMSVNMEQVKGKYFYVHLNDKSIQHRPSNSSINTVFKIQTLFLKLNIFIAPYDAS